MREMSNQYKKTKFGLIPNDWEIKKLKNIGNSTIGLTYSPKDVVDEEGILVLRSSNIKDGRLSFQDNVYVKKNVPEKLLLKKGDILVCSRNGSRSLIGKNVLITEDTNYTFGAFMSVFRSKYNEYLYQLFQTNMYQKQIQANLGATINQITTKDLNSFQFPFPKSEKEQKKIISILSTWDKAIELKEKLIEQKKELKKGLMQKLLTGEVRLPGFEGVWKKVRLGNIGKTYNGLSGKSAEDFGEGKPYIPYKTIFDDSKIDINKLDYVRIEENEKQNKAKYGDIFFTTSSETPDEVGMSSVLLDHIDEVYLNSFCFGYRLNDFNVLHPEFAQYLFRSNGFRKKTLSLAQGSTRFNISKNEVMKIEVLLPPIEEQKLIASILTNSDREIKLLQKQVELIKEQKKGLMQLLLTGKVRVKV